MFSYWWCSGAVLVIASWVAYSSATGAIIFDVEGTRHMELGDKCIESSTGQRLTGYCNLVTECPKALEAYTTNGAVRPTSCGYLGNSVLVCCSDGLPQDKPPPQIPVSLRQPRLFFRCGKRPEGAATQGAHLKYDIDGNSVYLGRGGELKDVNTWPWTALLGWPGTNGSMSWRCMGALISERWVLTAAHCLRQGPPAVVRLGEYDLTDDTDGYPHEDFGLRNYHIHSKYVGTLAYHDIALLELDRPVQLDGGTKGWINPVCLPWGEEITAKLPKRNVHLTGWRTATNVLQDVLLHTFRTRKCEKAYSTLPTYSQTFPSGITNDTFLCAGNKRGGKGSCSGYSGGPLQYRSAEQGWVLTGVMAHCGHPEYPGLSLYTPLHNQQYLLWIRKHAFF